MINKLLKYYYNTDKATSRGRGIDFLLTFEEYSNIWISSGHFSERGKYGMYRIDTNKPIECNNVIIRTRNTIGKTNQIQKKRQMTKVICPHCNKEGSGGAMVRSHFDNCKQKEPVI